MRPLAWWSMVGFLGCAAVGPERVAADYARALRDDRLPDAYGLLAAEQRGALSYEQFRARHADAAERERLATAVLAASDRARARLGVVEVVREAEGWRVIELGLGDGPRQVGGRFLDAVEKGDYEAAYLLLSGHWRERYTPERLRADFESEPLSGDRLRRARAALTEAPVFSDDGVAFPIGPARALRLVPESGTFRVSAIE